jgi:hypothetical protein
MEYQGITAFVSLLLVKIVAVAEATHVLFSPVSAFITRVK